MKQINTHIEKVKDQVKVKINWLKKKIKNPFDFKEYVEKQKHENEIDLSFFCEFAEENKIIYKQVPINTLIEDQEKMKNGFFTNGFLL